MAARGMTWMGSADFWTVKSRLKPMDNVVLTPVPLADLLAQFREIVKEEIRAHNQAEAGDKLLSPDEARKGFDPAISKPTVARWTKDGLIQSQRIGGRIFYKYSDLLTAGASLKRYKATRI